MVKIWVDYQTYREIELVWNFDLSMFSVYGGGACPNVLIVLPARFSGGDI